MSTHLTATAPTLALAEVAVVTGIDAQLLRNWVARGVVVPAVRGSRGRNSEHRFSASQALGITLSCWMYSSSRGCRPDYVTRTVEEYEAWPFPAVQHFLGLGADEFTEEALARVLPCRSRHGASAPVELLPDELADAKRLFALLMGLRSSLLAHLRAEGRVGSSGGRRGATNRLEGNRRRG